ncbi:MAG: ferrous iron transport protein A [Oscillospiraceae bacterium]|nr:ferrous iron transport protein A [Oscillospiraceae bacterium]MBQ4545421.1 ferrous iron transport protein A [Oscillospiraceae bacterium]MBQ6902523.1 ferrous iron transport protein A [Oscillospiraceae bacterium]
MNGICRLCDMNSGETGEIAEISHSCKIRQRLSDLGFICGTKIECLTKSPLGDPTAFLVRGTVIALRREDSRFVKVRVI